jgi:hypothetical protein
MKKYGEEVKRESAEETHKPDICGDCGLDFKNQPKKDTRTQIAFKCGYLCDCCYEKLLFQQGRHSKIGTPVASIYRDALWPV